MTTLKANQFHFIDDLAISTSVYNFIKRIENTAGLLSATLNSWIARSHDRRVLAQMSDHMLSDIGLDRMDVARELNKFFWQR